MALKTVNYDGKDDDEDNDDDDEEVTMTEATTATKERNEKKQEWLQCGRGLWPQKRQQRRRRPKRTTAATTKTRSQLTDGKLKAMTTFKSEIETMTWEMTM